MAERVQDINSRTTRLLPLLCMALLCMPGAALAEVSDKMPSMMQVLVVGVISSVLVLLAAWYRWWLALVCSPLLLVFVSEPIALWNDPPMREALLQEQGYVYFGVLISVCVLLTLALILGMVAGRRHRKTTQEVDAP